MEVAIATTEAPASEQHLICCETCHRGLGVIDYETLSDPIKGSMFKNRDNGREGFWRDHWTQDEMKCPFCNHIVAKTWGVISIKMPDGQIVPKLVPKADSKKKELKAKGDQRQCPICGKWKHKIGIATHMKYCQKGS